MPAIRWHKLLQHMPMWRPDTKEEALLFRSDNLSDGLDAYFSFSTTLFRILLSDSGLTPI